MAEYQSIGSVFSFYGYNWMLIADIAYEVSLWLENYVEMVEVTTFDSPYPQFMPGDTCWLRIYPPDSYATAHPENLA